jgi:hypothetical protein
MGTCRSASSQHVSDDALTLSIKPAHTPSDVQSIATTHIAFTAAPSKGHDLVDRCSQGSSNAESSVRYRQPRRSSEEPQQILQSSPSSASYSSTEYSYSSSSPPQSSTAVEGEGSAGSDEDNEEGFSSNEADMIAETEASTDLSRAENEAAEVVGPRSESSESMVSLDSSGPSHLEADPAQICMTGASELGRSELGVSALDSSEGSSCVSVTSSMCAQKMACLEHHCCRAQSGVAWQAMTCCLSHDILLKPWHAA